MQTETPQMLLRLAMSAMLSTHAWGHPGAHVLQMIQVLSQLRNPPLVQCSAGHPKVLTRLSLVMIHNYGGIGTGHLVIKACVEMA